MKAFRFTFIMLMAAAVLLIAVGANAQGRTNGQTDVNVPGVQLTEQQKQWIANIRTESQQEIQRIRTNPDLSALEKTDRIAKIRHESHERILSILTPEQRTQFNNWWKERQTIRSPQGADSGQGVPGVQLTPEQRQEIARIREDLRVRVQEIRRDQTLSQAQKVERVTALRKEAHDKVLNVLTPEQRRQFQNWWTSRQQSALPTTVQPGR